MNKFVCIINSIRFSLFDLSHLFMSSFTSFNWNISLCFAHFRWIDSLNYVQNLDLYKRLKVHKGCVNTVSWNEKGQYLLSGSDDQTIVVTNPFNGKVLVHYNTAHRANIFSAKFLPQTGDRGIVSCSGDGVVLYTELTTAASVKYSQKTHGSNSPHRHGSDANDVNLNYFNCHSSGTTYEVLTVPTEPNSFMR